MLLDGMSRINRDLIIGCIAGLDAKVVVFEVDVEIRMDQLILDELLDYPCHFIAIKFDDRICYLDLRHSLPKRLVSKFLDFANAALLAAPANVGRYIARNNPNGKAKTHQSILVYSSEVGDERSDWLVSRRARQERHHRSRHHRLRRHEPAAAV